MARTSGPRIPLCLVGCDYRTAGSDLRSRLILEESERKELAVRLRLAEPGAGLMVLETCNRVEWIAEGEHIFWVRELLTAWMRDRMGQHGAPGRLPLPYCHGEESAVDHVLRVVAGMESLSAGEAQIAGQFQRALGRAVAEKTAGKLIRNLGSVAGRVARTASVLGFRSSARAGIHDLAASYLTERIAGPRRALVVGMGEIGRRIAAALEERAGLQVIRMNRTVDHGNLRAWRPLTELYVAASAVSAIVLATAAHGPVLELSRLSRSSSTPLVVLDVGVPAQAEGTPGAGVAYAGLDALAGSGFSRIRPPVLLGLEVAIEREKARFRRYAAAREVVAVLDGIRRRHARYAEQTMPERVRRVLGALPEPERRRVEALVSGLLREYSGELIASIYESLEEVSGERS